LALQCATHSELPGLQSVAMTVAVPTRDAGLCGAGGAGKESKRQGQGPRQTPTSAVGPGGSMRKPLLCRDRYEAMIRSCGHKGDVQRAEALLQLMQADGFDLSVETCNMVVNACTQSGNIERAQWHVEQMQRKGLKPDMVTFNSMLNGLAAVGDLKGVEDCYRMMFELGVAPNCVTFGTICKAFARVGDFRKVESVMRALDKAGQPLNEYFFASLIAACGAAQPPRAAKAERAFHELVRRGLRPQSVKSALVRAVGKKRATALLNSRAATEVSQGLGGNWECPAVAHESATGPASESVPVRDNDPGQEACAAPRFAVQSSTFGGAEVTRMPHASAEPLVAACPTPSLTVQSASFGGAEVQRAQPLVHTSAEPVASAAVKTPSAHECDEFDAWLAQRMHKSDQQMECEEVSHSCFAQKHGLAFQGECQAERTFCLQKGSPLLEKQCEASWAYVPGAVLRTMVAAGTA